MIDLELEIALGARAKGHAAAPPDRRPPRTVPSPPGPLLAPGFAAAAPHLAAHLGVGDGWATIGHLNSNCLLHQTGIKLNVKDRRVKVDGSAGLAR